MPGCLQASRLSVSFWWVPKATFRQFFWLQFRNGLGTKPAGVLPFVVQSISRASLLGLDVLLSFSIVRFVGTKPAGVLLFLHALPKDLFLGFCRSVGDVLDVLLSFSSAFRR